MKYHETVPDDDSPKRYIGRCYDAERIMQIPVKEPDWCFGPLPSTNDEAIALACELAFARMVVADYQWCSGNGTGPTTDEATRDVMPRLSDCEHRFVRKGERSITLYRDMERVTGELTGEKQ